MLADNLDIDTIIKYTGLTKKEIEEQSKTNESLSMKINELASLDKIEEVAKEQGLSYNNDNIKNIDE